MKHIEYLIGNDKIHTNPLQVYSDEAIAFCVDLSLSIRNDPELRRFPDVLALAFWCRKANMERMKNTCPESYMRLGRGVCFHIAPGNVPVNFAFTYLFGILAGCSNIVRLPSRTHEQTLPLVQKIRTTLSRHSEIEKRTVFVQYPADQATTAEFSLNADARLIWGGDHTIKKIRTLPTKPRCVDVTFADRYSICILDGKEILKTDKTAITRLAEAFYNDTYLMDQNACSSPQIIFWYHDDSSARERFWNAVYACAQNRYKLQPLLCIDKYAQMCENAVDIKGLIKVHRQGNLLYHAELSKLESDLTHLRGVGGFFYECTLDCLDTLVPHITEKYQTVTYFGIKACDVQRFIVKNNLRGIDRIVPVGKALELGVFWDGFDIVRHLSRLIMAE